MMQQQLLLIILGVIIVGIAIALGFIIMNDQATTANRDHLTIDLLSLAVRAQVYYRRPIANGGGDGSFNGLKLSMLTGDTLTSDGSFAIVGTPANQGPVRLRGLGKATGTDKTNPVQVEVLIYPDTIALDPNSYN